MVISIVPGLLPDAVAEGHNERNRCESITGDVDVVFDLKLPMTVPTV